MTATPPTLPTLAAIANISSELSALLESLQVIQSILGASSSGYRNGEESTEEAADRLAIQATLMALSSDINIPIAMLKFSSLNALVVEMKQASDTALSIHLRAYMTSSPCKVAQ